MITILNDYVEKQLNEKKFKNQILFYMSVGISIFVVVRDVEQALWAFYFAGLAILSLPNINKSKKDLKGIKSGKNKEEVLLLLDVFQNSKKEWVLYMKKNKEDFEYKLGSKIQIKDGEILDISNMEEDELLKKLDLQINKNYKIKKTVNTDFLMTITKGDDVSE